MAPSPIQHRRTHNLLLANNLLSHSGNASPFTLVIDSLEQTGRPLLNEVLLSAKAANLATIYLAFETLQKPDHVDVFISAWSSPAAKWHEQALRQAQEEFKQGKASLVVVDNLNAISSMAPAELPGLLSSLISPSTSLMGIYHCDIPAPVDQINAYNPTPLETLSYLATTIFTVHSLHHVVACKLARDRSVVEPLFGLREGQPGILQGIGTNSDKSIVLEMEHRRKSGRGIKEWYILDTDGKPARRIRERLTLLEDHPSHRPQVNTSVDSAEATPGSTFELGLTDKQRQDRDGVVLPYFDAQKGNDEGGRILYDMGSEDDFDEEEDEI